MTVRDNIEAAIDEIRPALQMDGGDCEVVDVDEPKGTVSIRLLGACGGCPMSTLTLSRGIERIVKERVPSIKMVETTLAF